MKKCYTQLLFTWLTCFTFLAGCNGSSTESGTTTEPAPSVVSSMTLTTHNAQGESQQSFNKDAVISVQAKVIDQFGQPMSGQPVNFIADVGTPLPASKLTDSNGFANIILNNDNQIISAGQITASILTFSASVNYEFVDIDTPSLPSPAEVSAISLATYNDLNESQQSFDKNAVITVQAKVTDQFGQPMSGQPVTFTADIGTLLPASKLTDENGYATVKLSNDNQVISAGQITASILTFTASVNYEFVDNDVTPNPPVLTTTLLLDNQVVTQFKSDQQVQITSILTDAENQPFVNQIIRFSADVGSLEANSALTDVNGVANVILSSPNNSIGAGIVTATYTDPQGLAFVNQINYEVLPLDTNNIQITLVTQNSDGDNQQSFDKNAVITLQATVIDQSGQPVVGQLVDFVANIGTLTPNTKLTDVNGLAIVQLSNDALVIGAASVTASLTNASLLFVDSADYEFVDNAITQESPTLISNMLLNGVEINQFTTDQQARISSTLTDADNLPLANQIISYSADVGVLDANTALTNSEGVASVNLSSPLAIVGAGVITATYTESVASSVINRFNYAILAADSVITDSSIRIGYFDDQDVFQEGLIKLSVDGNTISAGGTLGLQVDLVDGDLNPIALPTPVTFTSNCVQNGNATIAESVLSVKGLVKATFEDINCAGVSGTDDVLIASVTANGITNNATATIAISGEELGSIEFISAEPESIVLKGSGGQGNQESSTLTFLVKSQLGNVLANQEVSFVLESTVGGIALSRSSGLTNSQGLVTTQVISGTVPTSVRVTAQAQISLDGVISSVQTQSDLLSINTGLAEQRSFTIAATILNPESDFSGTTSQISVWLADNFNNPVHDGTSVIFTAEGGNIEDSCLTVNGHCSVTWTSSEPRVPDHRITILATTNGHETFFDSNGNNTFDDNDGSAIVDAAVSSGFGRHIAEPSGFIDMSEVWRDDNENGVYDPEEPDFRDTDGNDQFSGPDGKFNGPQCEGALCAGAGQNSILLRKAMVLTMSSSTAFYIFSDAHNDGCGAQDETVTIYQDNTGRSADIGTINNGQSKTFKLCFADNALQTLPLGSTVSVSLSGGDLQGQVTYVVGNNNSSGYQSIDFVIANPVDIETEQATLNISITTPITGTIANIVKVVSLP
jgi:protocatechuate 3,4-dioxygenase beta subunit